MTLGTLGVVAAGSIAGVAVYRVTAGSTVQAPPVESASISAPAASPEPVGAAELPPLPVIKLPAVGTDQGAGAGTDQAAANVDLTANEATALVLERAPGKAVQATAATRDGYRAWAVSVRRSDGSQVTGFVDRASGVVFAWRLDQQAQAPGESGAYADDADDDADASDSENEGAGKRESDEHSDDQNSNDGHEAGDDDDD